MGNDDNVVNSGRANSIVANSASYGRLVVAAECAMAAMERIMEEPSYTATNGRLVVVTHSTMVATEE